MNKDTELKIDMTNNKTEPSALDKKEYMKQYKKNNLEKWYSKVKCNICGGSYTPCNRATHFRCKKHMYALLIKENTVLQEKILNLQIT